MATSPFARRRRGRRYLGDGVDQVHGCHVFRASTLVRMRLDMRFDDVGKAMVYFG